MRKRRGNLEGGGSSSGLGEHPGREKRQLEVGEEQYREEEAPGEEQGQP